MPSTALCLSAYSAYVHSGVAVREPMHLSGVHCITQLLHILHSISVSCWRHVLCATFADDAASVAVTDTIVWFTQISLVSAVTLCWHPTTPRQVIIKLNIETIKWQCCTTTLYYMIPSSGYDWSFMGITVHYTVILISFVCSENAIIS